MTWIKPETTPPPENEPRRIWTRFGTRGLARYRDGFWHSAGGTYAEKVVTHYWSEPEPPGPGEEDS